MPGKLVSTAVVLRFSPDGSVKKGALPGASATPRKRKHAKRLRGVEKLMRRVARAYNETSRAYLSGHETSNQKKKNGWLRDLPKNTRKASRRGMKILKLRLF